MRHEVTTPTDAPAGLVWRTIRDVDRWPDWTPTMNEVRRLDDGDLRRGSTAVVRQPMQPARTWTVTEVADGRSFTWVTGGAALRMSAGHTVRTDDGTTVIELSFTMTGPLAFLASMVGGKAVRRAVDTEAASLRAWCEKRG
jgi:uncharacterized membrane protein